MWPGHGVFCHSTALVGARRVALVGWLRRIFREIVCARGKLAPVIDHAKLCGACGKGLDGIGIDGGDDCGIVRSLAPVPSGTGRAALATATSV